MRFRILSIPPPLSENPYQLLLYEALGRLGDELIRDVVPEAAALRGAQDGHPVLHVHWMWLAKDPLRNLFASRAYRRLLSAARRGGWTVLWTAHNAASHEASPGEDRLLCRLAAEADGIIVHSQAARDAVAKRFSPRAPIEIIPHGNYRAAYAPPPDRAAARKHLLPGHGRRLALFFGQIRPYKGVEHLIDAWHHSDLDAQLLVAGRPARGIRPRGLHDLAAGDPRIRLDLRAIGQAEVPALFAAADRVILPFRQATTSGSAILALGFGRPLVLPDLPFLRELVTSEPAAAEFFESDAGLVPAIRRAFAADAPASESAATRIADTLEWTSIAAKTHAFLERLRSAAPC